MALWGCVMSDLKTNLLNHIDSDDFEMSLEHEVLHIIGQDLFSVLEVDRINLLLSLDDLFLSFFGFVMSSSDIPNEFVSFLL